MKALLLSPDRPIQIVYAGKAHPHDDAGKEMIRQIIQFSSDPDIRHRITFVPDYDIAVARTLYQGCDVWLNNPRRPLEACGTSGEKAALNGVLNLSILDGWWDEMFDGENGWAISSAEGYEDIEAARHGRGRLAVRHPRAPGRAAVLRPVRGAGAAALGAPDQVVAALARSAGGGSRMVRDYVEQLYEPIAGAGRRAARRLGGDAGGPRRWRRGSSGCVKAWER